MTLHNLRGEWWGVEVPEGSKWHQLVHISAGIEVIQYYIQGEFIENKSHCINIPPGSWQIVCLSAECSEEIARQIVHSSEWYFPEQHIRYVDYAHPFDRYYNKQRWSVGFGTALESLSSLLRSKGLNEKTTLILKKQ